MLFRSVCPSEWGLCVDLPAMDSNFSFHSIVCPSEWGLSCCFSRSFLFPDSFHSIVCPSEWGPGSSLHGTRPRCLCFHSIVCPSEWGPDLPKRLEALNQYLFPFNCLPQRVGPHPQLNPLPVRISSPVRDGSPKSPPNLPSIFTKKPLKPLPSKASTDLTNFRRFSPFPRSVAT